MPTYDYRCDSCGRTFERFQSITAAPIKTCIYCGKPRARRLIGMGAGLIFKGSGFYITDYRSDSYKNAAKAESSGGNGSSTGSSGGNGNGDGRKSSGKSGNGK